MRRAMVATGAGAKPRPGGPKRGMPGRVRWGNVGRVCGVVAVVAVVVAWPRLESPVGLPGDELRRVAPGAPPSARPRGTVALRERDGGWGRRRRGRAALRERVGASARGAPAASGRRRRGTGGLWGGGG